MRLPLLEVCEDFLGVYREWGWEAKEIGEEGMGGASGNGRCWGVRAGGARELGPGGAREGYRG